MSVAVIPETRAIFNSRAARWSCHVLVAALLISVVPGGAAWSAEMSLSVAISIPAACETLPRPQDQNWLVSSRSSGCDPAQMQFWQLCKGRWVLSSREAFLAMEAAAATTSVYVHGHDVNIDRATREGWQLYAGLVRQNPQGPSLCYVIYTWPADMVYLLPIKDARLKATRTDPAGYQLAWLLNQLEPHKQVCLLGHSFGARIVCSTLHLLGGGQIQQFCLAATQPHAWRAVLISPALDNDWLLPGRPYGCALAQVECMLILFNPQGRILRHYPGLQRGRHGPEALGHTGLAGANQLGPDLAKIKQVNAHSYVGPYHAATRYIGSENIVALMRPYALFAQ
jgi:hypothetical protein